MRPNNNPVNFGTIAVPALTFVGNAGKTSIAMWATDILRASVQVVISGAVVNGTMQLQISNDIPVGANKNQFQPTNWSLIGSAVTLTATGAYLIPYIETSYEYISLKFVDSSAGAATGVVSAIFCSKGL